MFLPMMCVRAYDRILLTSTAVAEMLLMTMLLSTVGLSDVIDPCRPPVPCVANTNMSDPHGDCAVYYVCQSSTRLWQRARCTRENNETTHYDMVTGLCLPTSLKPTCHDQCPGESLTLFHHRTRCVIKIVRGTIVDVDLYCH